MSRDKMYVVLRNNKEQALAAWKRQYFVGGKWGSTMSGPADETYRKMKAAKTLSGLLKVVGNGGWVDQWCDCCAEYKPLIIRLGYDDAGASVCEECLKEATKMLRDAKPDVPPMEQP